MSLLSVRRLGKSFGGVAALADVSLDLEAGSIHGLCGENGAGKSTLLKILGGCHPAGSYQGEVRMGEEVLSFSKPRDSQKSGLAFISQELNLVPQLSIAENMCLGRFPTRAGLVDWDALARLTRPHLEAVGLAAEPSTPVARLSLGQQQQVEIAKALSQDARVLILDEPTSALSPHEISVLLSLLKKLKARGVGIFFVSHHLEEVLASADTISVLRDGRLVGQGPIASWSLEGLVKAMVGRPVGEIFSPAGGPGAGVLLEVQGWGLKPAGKPWAVKDVSFSLRRGEVLGIAGLMGAGRSALLGSLFGAGRGRVEGRLRLGEGALREPFRHPREAVEAGLCLLTEDRKASGLVQAVSVTENLGLASMDSYSKGGLLDWDALGRACEEQVRDLRIKVPSGAGVAGLSGGNQQKVLLGRWFLTKPRVLLLDEPTRGIDVGAKAEIYKLLEAWLGRGGAVLMASSDLLEILGFSHRVMVLAEGRVKGLWPREACTQERIMAAAVPGPGLLEGVA